MYGSPVGRLDVVAGDAAGARVAMRRNIEDGCMIVESAVANALARSYLGRRRSSETPGAD